MLMWAETNAEDVTAFESDRRANERISLLCSVRISQTGDTGTAKVISAQVLDMSSSGVLIHASRAIRIASDVRIQGNELLTGIAQVRHCSPSGRGFRIGLEFATALQERF
jgi:hypothetical protein